MGVGEGGGREVCRAKGGGSSDRSRAGEPSRKFRCFLQQREDVWLICFKAAINHTVRELQLGVYPPPHLPTAQELQLAKHLALHLAHCLMVTCRTQTDNQTGSNQNA